MAVAAQAPCRLELRPGRAECLSRAGALRRCPCGGGTAAVKCNFGTVLPTCLYPGRLACLRSGAAKITMTAAGMLQLNRLSLWLVEVSEMKGLMKSLLVMGLLRRRPGHDRLGG